MKRSAVPTTFSVHFKSQDTVSIQKSEWQVYSSTLQYSLRDDTFPAPHWSLVKGQLPSFPSQFWVPESRSGKPRAAEQPISGHWRSGPDSSSSLSWQASWVLWRIPLGYFSHHSLCQGPGLDYSGLVTLSFYSSQLSPSIGAQLGRDPLLVAPCWPSQLRSLRGSQTGMQHRPTAKGESVFLLSLAVTLSLACPDALGPREKQLLAFRFLCLCPLHAPCPHSHKNTQGAFLGCC